MNRPKKYDRKPIVLLGLLGVMICLLALACRQTPVSKTEPRPTGTLPDLPSVAGPVPTNESELLTLSAPEQAVGTTTTRPLGAITPAVEVTRPALDAGTATTTPSATPKVANDGKESQALITATTTRVRRSTPLPASQPESTTPPQLPTGGPTELALTAPPPIAEETPEADEADAPPGSSGSIVISALEFTREQVTVTGQTTVVENECILTRLSADEEEELWWPTDTCAERQGSSWQLAVHLEEGGVALDPAVQYVLTAWVKDEPAIVSQPFPWDVGGPPEP